MSQALHTASTGINAGQSQINVVANNVANINTTAYKSANMVFETLYSNNLSYGKAATGDGGGTNPKQIGLGVKVGGITKNFNSGEYVATGRDLDLMISGNGFFVVQDASGAQHYTRDGVFSLDSNGNLVTQTGMKVVATKSLFSTSSSDKTVSIPKNILADIKGDPAIGTKTLSELNNASIIPGNVQISVKTNNQDPQGNYIYEPVTLTIPEDKTKTLSQIIADFNTELGRHSNITNTQFSVADGKISYTGEINFESKGTTSNFIAQTGLNISNESYELNQIVELSDVINYNDQNSLLLKSATVDENGIVVATYNDGSILTQMLNPQTESFEWKYVTPQGVTITANDVNIGGGELTNSQFVLEMATMVNEEGLISQANNLWDWGPNVGEIYYGMAGEHSLGVIESGGYEGSNVDIAQELTNMIKAQRMIQMNSRVFSTASTVMETLAYLGQ